MSVAARVPRHSPRERRRDLKFYGFPRSRWVRYASHIAVASIIITSLASGVAAQLSERGISGPQAATAVATLGALGFAYKQWRAAREEISLDKFYDRLDRANRILNDCKDARELMNPDWLREDYSPSYEHSMYIFMELDNLEYAIEKYSLGYMNSANAYRALSTFMSRCNKPSKFKDLVLDCAKNFGYNQVTVDVVERVLRHPAGPPKSA